MATGQPTKTNPASSRVNFSLSYPGKKSEQEILTQTFAPSELLVDRKSMNRLYLGDNRDILLQLLNDPTIKGRVNLVYIDPPYATGTRFHTRGSEMAYSDDAVGPEYLEALRERLVIIRELLSKEGSFYIHLDEKMIFHAKVILDEIFGISAYKNCIVRRKCHSKNYTRKKYGNVVDYILFYTRSETYCWNRPTEAVSESVLKEYRYTDEDGRKYMLVPLHAPGVRNGETGKEWHGMLPPPGKHWQFTPERLDHFEAKGHIHWSKNGNPRRKVYLDEHPGTGVNDIWLEFKDAHNQNINITGYPTEKNIEILNRIIEASTKPGDIILDCYAGSGTTLISANNKNRNWIGIDESPISIQTIVKRLYYGVSPMGDYVTKKNPKPEMSLFDEPEKVRVEQSANKHVSFNFLSTIDNPEASKVVKLLSDYDLKEESNTNSLKVLPNRNGAEQDLPAALAAVP